MGTEIVMEKGTLIVEGPNEITYLQVFDTALHEVAAGTHRLSAKVEPGIYRVLATVPGAQAEQLVAVEPGGTRSVGGFHLDMDAAVPLRDVRSFDEHHGHLAELKSETVHIRYKSGTARCFVFARTKGEGRSALPTFTLRSKDGEVVAQFPEVGEYHLGQGWLALTVDLPPGTYALEQSTPEGVAPEGQGQRGQVIFAEEGWETQLFAPWGEQPNFAHSSIYLCRLGSGFQPHLPIYGQTEAALNGLARGQLVLPPSQQKQFFEGKVGDPMLGLIGSYALLSQREPDYGLIAALGGALLRLLPHSPDAHLIVWLGIVRGDMAVAEERSAKPPFREPFLFALGTETLVRFAARLEELCPSESWLAGIAPRLTTGSAWTRWESEVTVDQALRRVYRHLRQVVSGPWFGPQFAEILALPRSVVASCRRLVERFIEEATRSGELDRQLRAQYRRFRHLWSFDEFQEAVLEKARERLDQFRGGSVGEFLAWLRCLSWSIAIDRTREKKREAGLLERLGNFFRSVVPPPSKEVEAKDLVAWLLGWLQERERKLILLRYFENKSTKQIAAALGCTESAVYQLHYRVLAKLRERTKDLSFDR